MMSVATLWQTLREGGLLNYVNVLLGLLGLGVAVVAAICAAQRAPIGRLVGALGLALGAVVLVVGLGGMASGRATTESAISGDAIAANAKERIRREGYRESTSNLKFALGLSFLPLALGAAAMLAARRKTDPRARAGGVDAPPAFSPVPALAGLGIGTLLAGANVAFLLQPLPGRDLDPGDPTWRLLDGADDIAHGAVKKGCDAIEIGLSEPSPSYADAAKILTADPTKVPNFRALTERCVDAAITSARTQGTPSQQRASLVALKQQKLAADPLMQTRIDAALAAIPASNGPSVVLSGVKITGALPIEVVQHVIRKSQSALRACYEGGLHATPKLAGRAVVRFTIDAGGAARGVTDDGSDLPDREVVACIVRTVSDLTFPKPEHGTAAVVCPIVLAP